MEPPEDPSTKAPTQNHRTRILGPQEEIDKKGEWHETTDGM